MDNVDKSVYNSLFSSFTSQKLWITIKNAIIQPAKDFPYAPLRETSIFTRKKELKVQFLFPGNVYEVYSNRPHDAHQKIRLTASTLL